MQIIKLHIFVSLCLCLLLIGCSKKSEKDIPKDALAIVGNSVLTMSQLREQLPTGVSGADSAKIANAYIKDWIDSQLIGQDAAHQLDMAQIDKMVQDYRNELIMMEYVRLMYDSHADKISEDSIRAYYDTYKQEFKLARPLVKGVYIKVADDAQQLAQIKRLYKSHKSDDIDRLDKLASTQAVHYDYFRDKWIDWEQIERRVPYDFGSSADNFLRNHSTVEFSQGGFTYLIDITEALHTGEVMPYEAASSIISDRLAFIDRRAYNAQLKKILYDKALENGKITLFVDVK